MNIRKIFSIVLLLVLNSPWAASNTAPMTNYWQCNAHDNEKNQWIGKNPYARVATNKAFEACKKESRTPASCKAPQSTCEYIVNGVSTGAYALSDHSTWQCIALDQLAKTWVGDTHSNRDDAALAAKSYCKKYSTVPDSCYINLLTCKNINGS